MQATSKSDGLLNLLTNVPENIKNKLITFSKNEEILTGKVELIVLFGEKGERVRQRVASLGGTFENLGYGFGIITVDVNNMNKVAAIKEIQYIELPKTLYTSFSESNRAACVQEAWAAYNVSGEGVLVGFIDTGIDYMHPAFMDEQGNTRIEYIYDLSKGGQMRNKAQINQAIKSPDPYSIVPEKDEAGHGTHVAGIACGGEKIPDRDRGVAYKSSIAMVKMTGEGKVNYGKSTQLMRGVKFLLDRSTELGMPLVINLSFSTNDGAHDGQSLLEQYINTVCNLERIAFAIAAGNDADRGHHIGAVLKQQQTISMSVGGQETSIILQLYKNLMDEISIEIKSPTGSSSGVIKVKQGYQEGNIDSNRFFMYNTGPKPISMNGEITISLVAASDFLTVGNWGITIYLDSGQGKGYDIWMPVSEGLNPNTKFLQPNPYNTLGIPATVQKALSVGSYNSLSDSASSFSGRGALEGRENKPDIVAPGEAIEAAIPGGGYDALTGTSMAAPHGAGACALMMQWGIVKANDPFMYGDRLKYFLLKSAKRGRTDVVYPSPIWGYGTLCVRGALDLASSSVGRNIGELISEDIKESKMARQACSEIYNKENYENYIIEYDGDIINALQKTGYACGFILDENYAVISVEAGRIQELVRNVKEVVYAEVQSLYTLCAISPLETSNISKFHTSPYLTLNGQGVLLGLIDTGIDYLNTAFQYEDDTTRIVSLWDQTMEGGKIPKGFSAGVEYTSEDINNAIAQKKNGGDPYAIVNSKDENGHGTSVAGIMGARAREEGFDGAAPDAEFVVVKLREAKKSTLTRLAVDSATCPAYESTDIILGIKYLFQKARDLGKPLVIHIPLGSNNGAHNASSILERFIDSLSLIRGLIVVTGTGNEGDTNTHTSGTIAKTGDMKTIELKVDENQKNLGFEIWCRKPDKVSLSIVSPTGQVIEKIPAKLQADQTIKFVFEGSTVGIRYYIPEESTGDELIRIRINNIRGGIWQFRLIGDYIADGRYDAWLPQRSLLMPGTAFLSPNQYTTLTVPATARRIIVASAYNQDNNTVMSSSGRGYTTDNRIKPDLAAGGFNVITTKAGGGTTTISGSSAASAVLAGAVALMLQWGIVLGNDTTLYSNKMITYLIRGTKKRPGDIYPNPEWGYGMLDLNGVFENIRVFARIGNRGARFDMPKEIYDLLMR